MAIITLSRSAGSLGDEIAEALAQSLGIPLIDKTKIEEALLKDGVTRKTIDKYDEKSPSFWNSFSLEREKYFHYLVREMYSLVSSGDGIILGRGAHMLFSNVAGVVRVRITAPLETQIWYTMEKYECSRFEAVHMIKEIDHQREGFHRNFFDTSSRDSSLYDMVLNSSRFDLDSMTGIIRMAAGSGNADIENIRDLKIGQDMLIDIRFTRKIPVQDLGVQVQKGNAVITGAVISRENIDLCKQALQECDEIDTFDLQLEVTGSFSSYRIQ